jgi:hypothetical protein
MAARIEDHHRDQVMMNQRQGSNKPWSPRQAVGGEVEEWDPPQSKSPPGRKPVPNYSVHDLQQMTQEQREEVASQVDPNDRLSKVEGILTPAQQIIAETRSRQMNKHRKRKHKFKEGLKWKDNVDKLLQILGHPLYPTNHRILLFYKRKKRMSRRRFEGNPVDARP